MAPNQQARLIPQRSKPMMAGHKQKQAEQILWNIIHSYLTFVIAQAGKVLLRPPMSEIPHHIQAAAKWTQNIQRDVSVIKNHVRLSTIPLNEANFPGGRNVAAIWASVIFSGNSRLREIRHTKNRHRCTCWYSTLHPAYVECCLPTDIGQCEAFCYSACVDFLISSLNSNIISSTATT